MKARPVVSIASSSVRCQSSKGPVPYRRESREEPGADDGLGIIRAGLVAGQDVPGQLLADEPVVRLVLVERVDDIVAIAGGLGHGVIGVVTGRVGVVCDIHPVPAPSLAVMRRGEQAVDDLGECIRAGIGEERINFLGRRR